MPKNPGLEYQASEPAFLRRMKAGQAALNGRHEVQIPRARGGIGRNERLNMDGEEGEDDPVMVDEGGNIISKEEMEKMSKDTSESVPGGNTANTVDSGNRPQKLQDANVISGLAKKRKAAKVVAADVDDESLLPGDVETHEDTVPAKSIQQSTKDLQDVVDTNKEATKKETANGIVTKKQKRKKVKLSFDEPE